MLGLLKGLKGSKRRRKRQRRRTRDYVNGDGDDAVAAAVVVAAAVDGGDGDGDAAAVVVVVDENYWVRRLVVVDEGPATRRGRSPTKSRQTSVWIANLGVRMSVNEQTVFPPSWTQVSA